MKTHILQEINRMKFFMNHSRGTVLSEYHDRQLIMEAVTYTAEPAPADIESGAAVLKMPMSGTTTEKIQEKLIDRGYEDIGSSDGNPDGLFGPSTKKMVEKYQSEHSYKGKKPLKKDGIVGPRTYYCLTKAPSKCPKITASASSGSAPTGSASTKTTTSAPTGGGGPIAIPIPTNMEDVIKIIKEKLGSIKTIKDEIKKQIDQSSLPNKEDLKKTVDYVADKLEPWITTMGDPSKTIEDVQKAIDWVKDKLKNNPELMQVLIDYLTNIIKYKFPDVPIGGAPAKTAPTPAPQPTEVEDEDPNALAGGGGSTITGSEF